MIHIPDNLSGKALYDFLIEHKSKLIAQKKAGLKYAESVSSAIQFITSKETQITKAPTEVIELEEGVVNVKVVCNAAWWCDSQMDVLTEGCYTKSVNEKGINIPHIHDHEHESTAHVGDVQAVYTQKIKLTDLGLSIDGNTTCLIMESKIREDYNSDVYKFYKNKKINQHSIGLIYVTLGMAINDSDYLAEFDLWNKYYDKVINKEKIDEKGYFWIVTEIKIMENSCVLFGSNELTPTLEINENNKSLEPENDSTHIKPIEKSLNIEKIAEYLNQIKN